MCAKKLSSCLSKNIHLQCTCILRFLAILGVEVLGKVLVEMSFGSAQIISCLDSH